ncbi:hypothetical protein Tco_1138479 [Tanacetum coccineum]
MGFRSREQDANIRPVVEAANTVVEVVAPVQPRRQGKRKSVVVDAGGASHPPKKLKEDHGTPSGASVGASVSFTLEHEDEDHTDFVAEPNLRTIGASQRFVISSDSSHHSGPTIAEAEVDSLRNMLNPFLFFAGSSSASGADPNTGVFSDLTDSDFLVGGIRTVIDPDTNL